MIIEIPFTYRAHVIRHRCRTLEMVGVRASLPVRIAEPDAPLAAVLEDGDGSPRIPYHAHAGGLVTPWRPKERWSDEHLDPVPAGDLESLMTRTDLRPFAACTPLDHRGREAEFDHRLDEGDRVQHWQWDDRREVAEAILRSAARCAVVDGLFCVPTEGPAWRVEFRDRLAGRPAAVVAAPGFENGYVSWKREFRGDRLADALAHARALRAAKGERPDRVEVRGRIEVLEPAAFGFDDDWHVLREAVGRVLKDSRGNVGSWPRALAIAWLDLRESFAAAKEGPFSADLLEAARAVASCGDRDRFHVLGADDLAEVIGRIDRAHAAEADAAPTVAPR